METFSPAILEALARRAGSEIMALRGLDLGAQRKEGYDVVTAADLAAEKVVLDELARLTPGVMVLSEEGKGGLEAPKTGPFWVLDPLDGTINFAAGLPIFAVSLALKKGSGTELGIVHMPAMGRMFRFQADNPREATVDGRQMRSSKAKRLADAVVSLTVTSHYGPEMFDRVMKVFDRLARRARGVRVIVCGAYELAAVASGRLDGHVCLKGDIFSVAAAMPMVEMAGGKVTRLDGQPSRDIDEDIIASNGLIHDELLDAVRG
jgi:myo-inositol-1(or 4)-monophosphatase